METSKVGKRGAIVVPARLRRKFGIEEGGLIIAEERPRRDPHSARNSSAS
jgi:AbrB family looped-hinge helix DNA binding protein